MGKSAAPTRWRRPRPNLDEVLHEPRVEAGGSGIKEEFLGQLTEWPAPEKIAERPRPDPRKQNSVVRDSVLMDCLSTLTAQKTMIRVSAPGHGSVSQPHLPAHQAVAQMQTACSSYREGLNGLLEGGPW